jgi:hypothetical protein
MDGEPGSFEHWHASASSRPRFVVAGWSQKSSGGTDTSVGFEGRQIATPEGWTYNDDKIRFLEVEAVWPGPTW